MMKTPHATSPIIEILEARIAPATFTVTTTADSGPGSLRQAILDANALDGVDSIGFAIEGDQLQIISLLSELPEITEKVIISAYATWETRTELVRIDGANAGANVDGLRISTAAADGSVVAGLQIANFSGSGIATWGASSLKIVANHIFGNDQHGIHVTGGSLNQIYGNALGLSDGIPGSTGNSGSGILLENSNSNRLAPPDSSITPMGFTPSSPLKGGNLIVGNGLYGIEIRGGESNALAINEITGNGSLATSAEQGGGIAVINTKHTKIGIIFSSGLLTNGLPRVYGNTISGNIGHGILIEGTGTTGTNVSGNSITANLSGDGVHINGATQTTFGEIEFSAESFPRPMSYSKLVGNTFSQNGGWGIAALNTSDTIVRASTIEGNSSGGIILENASNITIGGTKTYYYTVLGYRQATSQDGNSIGFGTGVGISVIESLGIEMTGNAFQGEGLPIDLGGDGPTINDSEDTDTGANHLQNHPELTISNGQLGGKFTTDIANTKFRIQFYKLDQSTGQYSIFDTQEVITNPNGTAVLTLNNANISIGQPFFATATNLTTGETSEFSPAAYELPRVSIGTASVAEGNSGVQYMSFAVTLDSAITAPVKVTYRSADGTAKAGEDYGAVEGSLTFEPGETSKLITVTVFGNAVEEASEYFHIDLTSVEHGLLATSRAAGTIINDDDLPTISIQDQFTVEGSSGLQQLQVTLSKPSLDTVTVSLTRVGGTATSSDYYGSFDRTITFSPGQTTATVSYGLIDDVAQEQAKTVQLQLTTPTGGTLGNANATLTIEDNDAWKIQTDAIQVVEGDNGQSFAIMPVRLVNLLGATTHGHQVTVNFSTIEDSALSGIDFVATQGTLTFLPGEVEKTILIPILGDTTSEQHETFKLHFSTSFGAGLQQNVQTVTILNDDAPKVSVNSVSITEGQTGQKTLTFRVDLSALPTNSLVVSYQTESGTAAAGEDFEAVSGTISFAPGETQKFISVSIYGDRGAEENETFILKLTDASGATISADTAIGTLLNDDPLIQIEDALFLEGQPATPGTRSVYLPVRLTQATDIPVTVDFSTNNGTAEASSDYLATSGTLIFAPGQTLQYIELQIAGDWILESDETFSVILSNLQGAQMGRDTGVVTIKADEPYFSAQNVTLTEGQNGSKSLVFTVNLSLAQTSAVTVEYSTVDGTTLSGSDYTATSGTLTFAPGETSKTISVPIHGDLNHEANETLKLLLSNASGAILDQIEYTGTIQDDDVPLSTINLIISKGGRKATWTDSDGDLVTLTATKGVLTPTSFLFEKSAEGDSYFLKQLNVASQQDSAALGLKFTVKKSENSDGLVNVGEINASGRDLTEVSLPGQLGSIYAGDDKLKTSAIRKLTTTSFGLDPASAQAGENPLLSAVKGSIDSLVIKEDFLAANLVVTDGSIRSLVIGGNLIGTSAAAPTGIVVDKSLVNLRVGGDIRGADPLHPVEIRTAINSPSRATEAIHQMKVGGDVENTNVVAEVSNQAKVSVGSVLVEGNWISSNLVAGAEAGSDGVFGTNDDAPQGTSSSIAKIIIRGTLSGTATFESATDHFGFVAGRIAAFQVGSQKLGLATKWNDSQEIGTTADVMLRELTGFTRS